METKSLFKSLYLHDQCTRITLLSEVPSVGLLLGDALCLPAAGDLRGTVATLRAVPHAAGLLSADLLSADHPRVVVSGLLTVDPLAPGPVLGQNPPALHLRENPNPLLL